MADRDSQGANRRRSMLALAIVVVLFVVGWVLAQALYQSSKLQDCILAGRTNCAPIASPPR